MQQQQDGPAYEEQLQIQRALEESKRDNPNPDAMSYEEMLELGDKLGKVKKGFTKAEIDAIPSRRYYETIGGSAEQK